MLRSRSRIASFILVASALLAGCGGASTTPGDPDTTKPSTDASAREVRAEDLETGDYPTRGGDVDETTKRDLANSRAVEAYRIANLVVDPHTVDPRFQVAGRPVGRLSSATDITTLFASEDPKLVATRVSGGASTRRFERDGDADPVSLSIAVMSFDTPAAAATFTKRIADKNETSGRDPIFRQPFRGVKTTLPAHPQARVSYYYVGEDDRDPSLTALRATGRMVIHIYTGGAASQLQTMRSVTSKALTMQLEALEGFEPKRLLQLFDAKIDPTGVGTLVMPLPALRPSKHEPNIPLLWDRNGALHQQTWIGTLPKAFDRADMDIMAQGMSNVYRTGSAKQAAHLLDEFEKTVTERQYREFHAPKGLREARCYEAVEESPLLAPYFCHVQHGRYIGEFGAKTSAQAEDGISAQYLIFQDAAAD